MRPHLKHQLIAALLGVFFTTKIHAQTTAFTYQGQLTENGSPATGLYDFRFELSSSPSNSLVIGVITNAATEVSNGLFTVTLDFGSGAFDGGTRWLEISARTNGGGAFSTLSPRQFIASAPYAIRAASVDSTGITGMISPTNIGSGAFEGSFAGQGSDLTSLNASELETGTVADARLSANVPLLDADQTFTGVNTFTDHLSVGGIIESRGANGGRLAAFNPQNLGATVSLDWKSNTARIRIGGIGGVSSGAQNGLDIQTTGDASLMRIMHSGEIGIGTTAPQADLHIVDGNDPTIKLQSDGTSEISGRLSLRQSNDTGADIYYQGAGDYLAIEGFTSGASDGVQLVVDNGSGNVGIGTTAPERLLHLKDGDAGVTPNGNSRLVVERDNSTFINVLTPGTFQSGILFGNSVDGSAAGGVVYNSANSPDGMQFRVNGNSAKMTIVADGDVGIGTTAPQAKLHVAGDLLVNGEVRTPPRSHTRLYAPIRFISAGASYGQFGAIANPRTVLIFDSVGDDVWLPIDLPDGATITAVSAFVHDDDAATNLEMTLRRQSFGGSTADNLATERTAGTPGDTLLEFLTSVTLDRSSFDYYLHVDLTDSPGFQQALFFYEVEIAYTTGTIE